MLERLGLRESVKRSHGAFALALVLTTACGGDDSGETTSSGGGGAGAGGVGATGGSPAGGGSGGSGTGASSGTGGSGGSGTSCADPEAALPAWYWSKPSVEIYVSPNGSDSNDGSSADKALQTTTAALAKLAPGVRLNFATGTYDGGYISNFGGTQAAPGWLRASDGPRTAKFTNGIGMEQVHYLALDGLEIEKSTGHGIQLSSGAGPWSSDTISHEVVLHRMYIHHTALASFKGSQAKGVYVIGNELAYANPDRQNVEVVVIDDVVVAGNEAHHSGYFNEHKGGALNGRIFRNYVHDSTGGILVGGDCTGQQFLVNPNADYEAKNLLVYSNLMVGGEEAAFRIVDCKDCTVANNTWMSTNPKAWLRILAVGFGDASGCDAKKLGFANLKVVNNVFYSATPPTYGIASNATPADYLTLTHNAWFAANGDVTQVASDIPFTAEPTSIYVDPGLVAPPSDAHPAASSPLVGKGIAVPGVDGNFEGKCWGGTPNIGAF